MATLHTVSRSPYRESTLESCLRMTLPGSGVLLLEDGVYAAVAESAAAALLSPPPERIRVYALAADLAARGIDVATVLDAVRVVDYEGFVDLACQYDKVQAWL